MNTTLAFKFVRSLRDRHVVCLASDPQDSKFELCVWRAVSSHSSDHPQEFLLAQFTIYVHAQRWHKIPFIFFKSNFHSNPFKMDKTGTSFTRHFAIQTVYSVAGHCLENVVSVTGGTDRVASDANTTHTLVRLRHKTT